MNLTKFNNLYHYISHKSAAAAIIGLAISAYYFGLTWTLLFGLSALAIWRVNGTLTDGDSEEDGPNSFENLYSDDKSSSKRKRMLAKRKENHLNRSGKMGLNGADVLGKSTENFEDSLSPHIMENFEFSVAEDFNHSSDISSGSHSGYRKQIPSLRSPQPLISAVKSRICIRDSKRERPLHPFGNKYPVKQNREVFRDLQNSSSPNMLSLYGSGLKESLMSPDRTIHKAISPLNGRYFSRINPSRGQDSLQMTFLSSVSDSKFEQTWSENLRSTEVRSIEDTSSTETVVKALKERITSKRKRNLPSIADLSFDTSIEQSTVQNKKRRLDSEKVTASNDVVLSSSLKVDAKNENYSNKIDVVGTPIKDTGLIEQSERSKSMENEKSASKYGMKDEEVNQLAGDETEMMEVCNKQNKRKASVQQTSAKKGKKDTKAKDLKKVSNTSKIPKRVVAKKTPVKSVETQTPSKLEDEEDKEKLNAKTPKQLKTPYRRIFTSGFPSNLKPGSTEKRRRIPIYFMSAGDSDNIDISREEYGEYGVTSDAYKAAKQAEADRVKEMLEESEKSETTAPASSSLTTPMTSQLSFGTSMTQPLETSSASVVEAPKATGFTIISKTTDGKTEDSSTKPNMFGNQPLLGQEDVPSTTGQSTVSIADSTKPLTSSGFNFGSFAAPTSVQSAVTSNATITSSISSTTGGLTGFSLSTKSAEGLTGFSLSTKSAEVGFNLNSQFKDTSGAGFTFGKPVSGALTSAISTSVVSTSVAAPSGSVAPQSSIISSSSGITAASSVSGFNTGFTFGTASNTSALSTQASVPSQTLTNTTTSTTAQFGGFSFGSQGKQDMPKPFSALSQTGVSLPNSTSASSSSVGGFSFGTSSDQKQATVGGFSFGNTTVTSSSSSGSNAPSVTGFSFNPSSTSSSVPTSKIGGFSFGATPAAPAAQPAVQPAQSLGGFAFGNKSTPATSATVGGFAFPAATTQSGFAFGKSPAAATQSSVQSQLPTPFGNPTSSQSSSIFPSVASTQMTSNSLFKPASSANATNLFGQTAPIAPSSSNLFGAKPQSSSSQAPVFGASTQSANIFGAASQAAQTSAPLFGTASSSTTGASLFGTSTQKPGSASLFGTQTQQAAQSTASQFVTPQKASAGFSFGNAAANPFGAASSSTGGFSFTNAAQSTAASSSTQNIFGQSTANTGSTFNFGQSKSNPFHAASAFGQPASTAAATPFAFGQSAQSSFGQSTSTQPAFGSSTTPAFGSSTNQSQSSGFNFGSSSQKPGLFSFSSGQSGGGLASRPGTPTPAGSNQPAPPGAMFGTPQPQAGGFALGSANTANRPQIKGRRRTRR